MINPEDAYEQLMQRSREIFTIESIGALTGWDQQVNMPARGVTHRGAMMAYLAQLSHQKQTDPHIGELLAAAEVAGWPPEAAANLREWRRSYGIATRLPEELVRRRAELITQANQTWEQARADGDYATYAPILGQLIELSAEVADHLGWQSERYDALLDLHEPGLTTAECVSLFGALRSALVPLLQSIVDSPVKAKSGLFAGMNFSTEAQREFGITISQALGFDYAAGRLDVSTHPFTQGIFPGDVRLTTRYDASNLFYALMSTIHEAGHGIYEQGLPLAHLGTPLGQSTSVGIHESQSRFFENNIGRSRAFWVYWFPRLRKAFEPQMDRVSLDDFYLALNSVRPSLIRTEADEVTYNLHIMVRFEIERDLFRGALLPRDLPDAWNAAYKAYLGVEVPNDSVGVLQDIHWSWASFGYFPTYTLGTVYAAQLEAALRRDMPDLDGQIAAGELQAVLQWLREHVHRHGMLYRSAILIERATGKPPSTDDYTAYLTRKYDELYL